MAFLLLQVSWRKRRQDDAGGARAVRYSDVSLPTIATPPNRFANPGRSARPAETPSDRASACTDVGLRDVHRPFIFRSHPAVFRPARAGARVTCSDDRRRMSPVSPSRRPGVGRASSTFANETPPAWRCLAQFSSFSGRVAAPQDGVRTSGRRGDDTADKGEGDGTLEEGAE